MIRYVNGDLFKSKADALVNPVNSVGVMGAGLAKKFKEKYPDMFDKYRELCKQGKFYGGYIHIYQIRGEKRFIVNFATKEHWKDKSKIEYIIAGLATLHDILRYTPIPIKSIAIPALGCGYGGLKWDEVKEAIEDYLSDVSCNVEVYIPHMIER